MDEEAKIVRFAEMEARARADETDWESFFQAAEAWEDLVGVTPATVSWTGDEYARRRWINAKVREAQRNMEPGFWTRLRTKITKRG